MKLQTTCVAALFAGTSKVSEVDLKVGGEFHCQMLCLLAGLFMLALWMSFYLGGWILVKYEPN